MSFPVFASGDVLNASDMNSVGLWLVKTQAVGATPVPSVTVTGAFSADYDNYLIQISGGVASGNIDLRFNFDGNTASYYSAFVGMSYGGGSPFGLGRSNLAYFDFAGGGSTSNIFASFQILSPFLAKQSGFVSSYVVSNAAGSTVLGSGYHDSATSFTGFRIQTSSGTLTGGTIRVYGMKN